MFKGKSQSDEYVVIAAQVVVEMLNLKYANQFQHDNVGLSSQECDVMIQTMCTE